jgi:hypothetical protein
VASADELARARGEPSPALRGYKALATGLLNILAVLLFWVPALLQASEKSHTVRRPPKGGVGGVLEAIVGLVAIVGYILSIVVGGLHEPLVWAVVAAITFMALGALALMRSQK